MISEAHSNSGFKEFKNIIPNLGSNGSSINFSPVSSVNSPKLYIYTIYVNSF